MKTFAIHKIIIPGLLIFILNVCKSQTNEIPDISADRPGMSTPPSLVEPGSFQIETGFSYEENRLSKPDQDNTHFNSTLFRFGINKNSEIRFQTDYIKIKTDSVKIRGFNPFSLGTKLLISDARGILPKTSFLFNLTLPYFGEKKLRPNNFAPSIFLLMQNDLTEKINICYNVGLIYDGVSPNPMKFAALCIGYGITDKLNAFIENYNLWQNLTNSVYFIDFGFAYIIGKNIQLDFSGNMNLQNIENYYMINFGVSWRIPK
jgi:hypothetical protein